MSVLGEEHLNIWKGVCMQPTSLRPQARVCTLIGVHIISADTSQQLGCHLSLLYDKHCCHVRVNKWKTCRE